MSAFLVLTLLGTVTMWQAVFAEMGTSQFGIGILLSHCDSDDLSAT